METHEEIITTCTTCGGKFCYECLDNKNQCPHCDSKHEFEE